MDWPRRDPRLFTALTGNGEKAFLALVDRHQPGLLRFAQGLMPQPGAAEVAVEQTWRELLGRLARFDGGAPLKVLLFGALIGVVAGQRGRAIDVSVSETVASGLDLDRFSATGERWEGHWRIPPQPWPYVATTDAPALQDLLASALTELTEAERCVVLLRDVEKIPDTFVSQLLVISDQTQRQLLHAARSHIRNAFERFHTARATS